MLQLTWGLPFAQCPSPSTSVLTVVKAAPVTAGLLPGPADTLEATAGRTARTAALSSATSTLRRGVRARLSAPRFHPPDMNPLPSPRRAMRCDETQGEGISPPVIPSISFSPQALSAAGGRLRGR